MFEDILTTNPLEIDNYEEKINQNKDKSNLNEAVITGQGNICGKRVCAAIMDSNFMMGSMGCAVGEKITRLVEYATKIELPLIIFTASGGARMQEGIFSLMQMAKISQAIAKHDSKGLLIENTIKQKLPDEFQTSEFAVEKGFVDSIVKRQDMKNYISKILSLHGVCENV